MKADFRNSLSVIGITWSWWLGVGGCFWVLYTLMSDVLPGLTKRPFKAEWSRYETPRGGGHDADAIEG